MKVNLDELPVQHLPEQGRFEIRVNGHIAELTYTLHKETILFTHTGVPPELEGQGVGSKLVKAGLEYARGNGLRIKSLCWFVTRYLQRHPEYQRP
ncbi:MAG: GNAT family N-acetyltransferase [Chloroflexota bacterium]